MATDKISQKLNNAVTSLDEKRNKDHRLKKEDLVEALRNSVITELYNSKIIIQHSLQDGECTLNTVHPSIDDFRRDDEGNIAPDFEANQNAIIETQNRDKLAKIAIEIINAPDDLLTSIAVSNSKRPETHQLFFGSLAPIFDIAKLHRIVTSEHHRNQFFDGTDRLTTQKPSTVLYI